MTPTTPFGQDPTDPLPTAARAALLGMMGGVSGVTPGTVNHVHSNSNGTRLRVTYTGWSPSLHAYDFDMEVNSPFQVDDKRLHRIPPASLDRAIDLQRRRLEAGVALGLHRPLPVPFTAFAGVETRHMHVDRTLVDLIGSMGGDFISDIAEAMANLHRSDDTFHCGDMLKDGDAWVRETDGLRLCGTIVGIHDQPPGRWITFDGRTLSIGGAQIAETAATMLTGRPLRDLVEVHPVLDGVTIRCVETLWEDGHPELGITLEPDHIPVPQPNNGEPTE